RSTGVARCGLDQPRACYRQQLFQRAGRRQLFGTGLSHPLLPDQRVGQHFSEELVAFLAGPVQALEHLRRQFLAEFLNLALELFQLQFTGLPRGDLVHRTRLIQRIGADCALIGATGVAGARLLGLALVGRGGAAGILAGLGVAALAVGPGVLRGGAIGVFAVLLLWAFFIRLGTRVVARRASSLGRAGLALAFLQRLFRRLAHLGVGRLLADIFQTRLGDLTPGGIAQLFLGIRHVIQRGALAVGGPGNAGVLGGVRRRGLGLGGVLAHVARLGRRLGYSTLRRLLGSAANGV